MDTEKLNKYAALKAEEKKIKAEIDMLAPDIMQMIQDTGNDKAEGEIGIFNLIKKKTWKFSEMVIQIKQNLKTTQENEKADGTATYTENSYLAFTPAKLSTNN